MRAAFRSIPRQALFAQSVKTTSSRRLVHTRSVASSSTGQARLGQILALSAVAGVLGWTMSSTKTLYADESHIDDVHPESDAPLMQDTATSTADDHTTLMAQDSTTTSSESPEVASAPVDEDTEASSEEEIPEDAGSAAFNPVTGEINWDCPCLGGMAHGVCGPQFREAFACFIHSDKEPKGIDCVEKFKNMQDCFRANPDVYGEELDDEDDLKPSPGAELTAQAEAESEPEPEEPPRRKVRSRYSDN